MKRRALLFTFIVVLALCAACGGWLHRERQQYALNRQLIAALERNDTATALALVNAGANPNTRVEPPPAPTVRLLLDHLLHYTPPPINDSPAAFLIACGADWNSPADMGEPLVIPTENLSLIQAMLTHGVDVRAKTAHGFTALHYAVEVGRLHTVELLLQHGAEINAPDDGGHTPLMWAITYDHVDVARLLLSHGANPNVQDMEGKTVLHTAAFFPIKNIVIPDLLAHGADPNLRAQDGNTPLTLAQHFGHDDVVRLLKQHGAK